MIGTKQQNSGVRAGWVDANVAKALVSGDEKALLRLNSVPKYGVFPTTHPLFKNTMSVVPSLAQPLDSGGRQVFIDLDAHVYVPSDRQRHKNILVNDVSGIGEGSMNIVQRQLRIRLPYLSGGHPIGKAADDHGDWHACAFDARIAVVDIW